jgi:hypothetical protein
VNTPYIAENTSDERLGKMPEWFRILRNAIMDSRNDKDKGIEYKITNGGVVDGEYKDIGRNSDSEKNVIRR